MRALLLLSTVVIGFGASSCRKEEPPPSPQDQRTLDKLRQQVDREASGAPTVHSPKEPEDPNAKLAALAAGTADPGSASSGEGPLALPTEGRDGAIGPLKIELRTAQTAHQLAGKKLTLTSEDLFLTVTAAATNGSTKPALFSIEQAAVVSGDQKWNVARDAQVLIGTRELAFDVPAGESRDVTLVFEVPPSALAAKELVLALPQGMGGNGDARLRLK